MASSRMIALLGLLAVAGYQNRDKLGDLLGRVTGSGTNPADPNAPRTAGGIGDMLGGLFGGNRDNNQATGTTGSQGGIGGFLGDLFGGGRSSSGGIAGGLRDLIDRFNGTGHGDEARTWVETGANRNIDERGLEEALGEDTIEALINRTGLSRPEVLARLRTVLPDAVDKLTPDGHLPSEDELERRQNPNAA